MPVPSLNLMPREFKLTEEPLETCPTGHTEIAPDCWLHALAFDSARRLPPLAILGARVERELRRLAGQLLVQGDALGREQVHAAPNAGHVAYAQRNNLPSGKPRCHVIEYQYSRFRFRMVSAAPVPAIRADR
jgi:hypothetical protein